MRRIALLVLAVFILLPVFAMDYHLMRDDSTDVYWRWYEQNNGTSRYWAVKYYTSDTCTLRTIDWGRWTKANKSYDDSVIVCFDNGGFPDIDSTIYSAVQTASTGGNDSIIRHTVSGAPLAFGDFWVVIYAETQNSNAYFLSDTTGSGYSYISGDGIDWSELSDGESTADAIIRMWVSGPAGMSLLMNEHNEAPVVQYNKRIVIPDIISSNEAFMLSIDEQAYVNAYLTDKAGRIIEQYCSGYMGPGEYIYNIQPDIRTDLYFIVVNYNGNITSRKLLHF